MEHGARRRFNEEMTVRRDAIAEQLFAERGGREKVDVITRHQIIEYSDLTVRYQDVMAHLMDGGDLTKGGRQRAAVVHAKEISQQRAKVAAALTLSVQREGEAAVPVGITRIERVVVDRGVTFTQAEYARISDDTSPGGETAGPPVQDAPLTLSGREAPTLAPAPEPEGLPSDGEIITTTTLEYGSKEREEATRRLWREFGIRGPEY